MTIRTYHCHIYFDISEMSLAEEVRQDIALSLPVLSYVGQLIPFPIGPHPKPMFELHIPASQYEHAVNVIEEKRQKLSVLIHPVQENELEAHTSAARWLGPVLPLNLSVLKQPHF